MTFLFPLNRNRSKSQHNEICYHIKSDASIVIAINFYGDQEWMAGGKAAFAISKGASGMSFRKLSLRLSCYFVPSLVWAVEHV